jgi:hypothetical protein
VLNIECGPVLEMKTSNNCGSTPAGQCQAAPFIFSPKSSYMSGQ